MSDSRERDRLRRWVKYSAWFLTLALLYVLADFSFDLRPAKIQSSYQFRLDELTLDRPAILQQDSLAIVVIRRSAATIESLRASGEILQDPNSSLSRQPDYAANSLRSREPEYFVAYALGTDLGCRLRLKARVLQEICGRARYDFAGRALRGEQKFRNLDVPDYLFSDNYRTLIIKP